MRIFANVQCLLVELVPRKIVVGDGIINERPAVVVSGQDARCRAKGRWFDSQQRRSHSDEGEQ